MTRVLQFPAPCVETYTFEQAEYHHRLRVLGAWWCLGKSNILPGDFLCWRVA